VAENEQAISISCFKDRKNGNVYEQVIGNSFVKLDKKSNEIKTTKKINTNKAVYVPINNKATKIGAIKLPIHPKEYGGTTSLLKEIDEHIYKYLDISDRFRKLSSWYVVMTWIIDNLKTINYLRAIGDYGTGKSRFFDVVGSLCYKPIPIAGAIFPAQLYRLMDTWKGTLLMDECVIDKSDESNYIIQVLNSGIQRGRFVWRCDKDNIKDVEPFDPFGPKVIASRKRFQDNALESRCITEELKQTKRKDIPVELPPEFFLEQQNLTDKLLMFRLRNWNIPNGGNIKYIQFPDCTKRMQQMMAPFAITYYNFKDVIKELYSFVEAYHSERVIQNSGTLQGGIVNAIWHLHAVLKTEQITSKLIKKSMENMGYEVDKVYEVRIGKERGGLGIKAKQKTIGSKSQMSVIWDQELMETLAKRYLPQDRRNYYNEKLRMNQKVVDDKNW